MKKLILLSIFSLFACYLPASAQSFGANNPEPVDYYESALTWVYPNPAINTTTILLSYIPARKVVVDLIDFSGNIRRSYVFAPGGNELSVDVSFLERGYYVLRIREGAALIDRVKLVKA